ncbi:MAG: hypothetical protein HUJ60_06645 [Bacilli bacterium]|nr:hypothetical protein [Bacilli bacterium]
MYRFFYQPETAKDVLYLVIDPLVTPDKVVENDNLVLLYREGALVGANLFCPKAIFPELKAGMIPLPCAEFLKQFNILLTESGAPALPSPENSGYLVAGITNLEEHPLDEKQSIVTLSLGAKSLITTTRYANLEIGARVVIAVDGCIKFDGQQVKATVIRNINKDAEICSPFDLRIGDESKKAYIETIKQPGEDFFA